MKRNEMKKNEIKKDLTIVMEEDLDGDSHFSLALDNVDRMIEPIKTTNKDVVELEDLERQFQELMVDEKLLDSDSEANL